MWTFHPNVGFFSAVIDKLKPGNMLIRFRDPDHGKAFIAAAWPKGRRPELMVTPPPADYRWKVSMTAARFVKTVAALAAGVTYDNFKSACHRSPVWRRGDSRLMAVWSTMNALQQSIVDEERRAARAISLKNLKSAINATPGDGKNYGTGTASERDAWLFRDFEDREGEADVGALDHEPFPEYDPREFSYTMGPGGIAGMSSTLYPAAEPRPDE